MHEKFTPGPWTVSGLPEIYGHDCINANGPEPVATVLRRFVRAENEANARLIAASPALYAACKALVQCLESHLDDEAKRLGCTVDELCPCKGHELKQARVALALAGGGE